MRNGRRDGTGRPRDQRLKLAIGAQHELLNDRSRQNPLALTDLGDGVAGLAQFVSARAKSVKRNAPRGTGILNVHCVNRA